jgi:hypothetical protein
MLWKLLHLIHHIHITLVTHELQLNYFTLSNFYSVSGSYHCLSKCFLRFERNVMQFSIFLLL